jgi:hypothetical protein
LETILTVKVIRPVNHSPNDEASVGAAVAKVHIILECAILQLNKGHRWLAVRPMDQARDGPLFEPGREVKLKPLQLLRTTPVNRLRCLLTLDSREVSGLPWRTQFRGQAGRHVPHAFLFALMGVEAEMERPGIPSAGLVVLRVSRLKDFGWNEIHHRIDESL